jgi:hypothetical protein
MMQPNIAMRPEEDGARTLGHLLFGKLAILLLVVLTGVMLLVGPGSARGAASAATATTGNTARREHTAPSPRTAIDQFAVNVSAFSGVPHPASVTWVASTRGEANRLLMDAVVGKAVAGEPVYVLEIDAGSGNFAPPHESMPPGGSIAPGRTLILIVDRSTFGISDWALSGGGIQSLAGLGTSETDRISGLRSMSSSAFRRRFG